MRSAWPTRSESSAPIHRPRERRLDMLECAARSRRLSAGRTLPVPSGGFGHDDAFNRGARVTLSQALATDRFVLTAEFGPPRNPDPGAVRAAARLLGPLVDAVNQ